MAREEDIDPPGAARVLKGLAADLAAAIRARADAFIAGSPDPREIDRDLRTVALIARAAIAVQVLQVAEDKADARALEAGAQRALFAVRALKPTPDEGDETDMNEPDPRLDDPEAMAEVSQEIGRRVDRLAQFLEQKRAARTACRQGETGGPDPLDRAGADGAAPA